MSSLSARLFKNPTPRTIQLVRTLGMAGACLLCIGSSMLPLIFYFYVLLQEQALRLSSVA